MYAIHPDGVEVYNKVHPGMMGVVLATIRKLNGQLICLVESKEGNLLIGEQNNWERAPGLRKYIGGRVLDVQAYPRSKASD